MATLRSRIKFGLEIATLLTALAALASVILSYRQIQLAAESSRLTAYQQIISNSIEFDKVLADHPELRPYFKDGKTPATDDAQYKEVALIAELQVDVIDSIVGYTIDFPRQREKLIWENTFKRSFHESPVTCGLLFARQEQYHEDTVRIAKAACSKSPKSP